MRNRATCIEPGCNDVNHARRYCQTHYQKHRRHGRLPNTNNPAGVYVHRAVGATCGVCGRSIYEHEVTEWCYINERRI